MERLRRLQPLETGLLLSFLLHLLVAGAFSWRWRVHVADGEVDPMEIDLSRPFRITDNPALARRAERPGAGAPVVEKPTLLPGKGKPGGEESVSARGEAAVKDWVLPDPNTRQVLEAPAEAAPAGREDGQGEGAGMGGLGGAGDGEVDWVYLTELPRLLNKAQLMKDVERFYPKEELDARREGMVVLNVHLSAEGRVVRVDVVQSAGAHFDLAARRVLSGARFSPAKAGARAVPVKMPQSLTFQLPD